MNAECHALSKFYSNCSLLHGQEDPFVKSNESEGIPTP